MTSPKGISLHIGLNSVDPSHYEDEFGRPWDGALAACEFDAQDMYALAQSQQFAAELLLTGAATADFLLDKLRTAAEALVPGDMLLVTYSGHGGQAPDQQGDEPDQRDETWCLFDRQVLDDELYAIWSRLPAKVRVLVLSDSCHSGSVTRLSFATPREMAFETIPASAPGQLPRDRAMPRGVQGATFQKHRDLYTRLQDETPTVADTDVKASVLLISGCQDNQLSLDGDRNGLFTATLRQVWAEGAFQGSYVDFHRQIAKQMPETQSPNYYPVGPRSYAFERQQIFRI